MGEKLSWNDIKVRYDRWWVYLTNYNLDEGRAEPDFGVVRLKARSRTKLDRLIAESGIEGGLVTFIGRPRGHKNAQPARGVLDVPPPLPNDAILAIEVMQVEMIMHRFFDDVTRYYLYDRQAKVGIEITYLEKDCGRHDVWKTTVLDNNDVRTLEMFLAGRAKPFAGTNEEIRSYPTVSGFRARWIDPLEYGRLRSRLTQLAEAQQRHEEAKRTLRDGFDWLRELGYFPGRRP